MILIVAPAKQHTHTTEFELMSTVQQYYNYSIRTHHHVGIREYVTTRNNYWESIRETKIRCCYSTTTAIHIYQRSEARSRHSGAEVETEVMSGELTSNDI